MERETITLDARAQHRLYVLNHVLTGEVTAAVAAANLRVTVRTIRRLLAAYRSDRSAAALVHGNRGRVPANRLDDAARARLLELATTTYAGANRAHLADLLAEREGSSSRSGPCAGLSPRRACPRPGPAARGATGAAGSG
jgi:hypothetical protein